LQQIPRIARYSAFSTWRAAHEGALPLGAKIVTELLVVFARTPELGKVKTRLSPPLTAEQALAVHRALVEDTLDHLGRIERPGLQRLLLLTSPLENTGDLNVPQAWESGVQSSGELGERLASMFNMGFRRGVTRLVVLGSDSPTIPPEVIVEAFDDLESRKVVIGPAEDGGYYLLGCSQWIPELFQGIDWGTETVLEQTMKILTAGNIPVSKLIPWYDIDRGEDLDKLRQEIAYLKRSAPELVPSRVAAALPDFEDAEYTLDSDF
jgi:rSAM/selenodomain-associated transferase 1